MLAASVALAFGQAAPAQTPPAPKDLGALKPASVLYIGSSFFYNNNGINNIVGKLVTSGDPQQKLASTMVTISGSGCDWHNVDSYFQPDAVARYTVDAANQLSFTKRSPLFDVAIMMDCSQCALHPQLKDNFHTYARKDAVIVRSHGAQPVFFMSWACLNQPEMTAALADVYTRAGNDNDALVIPASLAFALALKDRPNIVLYVADKRQPTAADSYFASATTYAALFRKSPVGLKEYNGLAPDTALALQKAAWSATQDYFGGPN